MDKVIRLALLKESKHELNFAEEWESRFPDIDLYWQYIIKLPGFGKKKVDFFHEESKTVIEIHGGIYIRGSHTFGEGFEKDRRFSLCCQLNNYAIIELTPSQINAKTINEVSQLIEKRSSR